MVKEVLAPYPIHTVEKPFIVTEFARVVPTPYPLGLVSRKNMWKDKGELEDKVEGAYPKVYAEMKDWMTYVPYVDINSTLPKEPIPFEKLFKGEFKSDDAVDSYQSLPKTPSKFFPSKKHFFPKEPKEPEPEQVVKKRKIEW